MKKIISVIGAGGKTTLIHRLAEEYQRKGNAVLVTTTTHMFAEPGTDLSGDAFSIREKLQRDHYCMAGIQCSENPQKMQALPEHTLRELLHYADVVLIEADGAKHHSLKYPSGAEPVIFSGTTDLYLVLGTWDIGKPCKKVIFRFDEMQKEELIRDDMELPKRKILPEEAATEEHIRRILRAYRYRLKEIGYNEKITCLFSKQDGENIRFCQADTDRASGGLQRCTEEYVMRCMTCTSQQECQRHSWKNVLPDGRLSYSMSRGDCMEKMQKRSKPVTLLISLLGSWIVTAVLLVLLAAAMMKFQLEEGKISAAVTVIYLGSAFLGGRIAGRRTENKKYLWGLLAGMCYFAVLFLLTLILKRNIDPSSIQTITTACLCMGGGMLGGMLAF